MENCLRRNLALNDALSGRVRILPNCVATRALVLLGKESAYMKKKFKFLTNIYSWDEFFHLGSFPVRINKLETKAALHEGRMGGWLSTYADAATHNK